MPGLDVIAFHFAQFKLLLALHADSLLPLVRFPLHVVGERADVQVPLVAVQDVGEDLLCPQFSQKRIDLKERTGCPIRHNDQIVGDVFGPMMASGRIENKMQERIVPNL